MRGFTIVETLVAITILTISIVVPFYAIQQGIAVSYRARDQLIASSLAQEAVEHLRSVRDGNYLAGEPWLQGIGICTGKTCRVDTTDDTVSLCAGNQCKLLLNGNLYNHSAGTSSRFTRTFTMERNADLWVKITVTVTWSTARQTGTVTVVEYLYNWL